ncbi:hypothetical protein [Burkholderia arboris]|nr:hypothetical protein [Burkholderia arboris]UTV60724.1 hypothetical protein NLX30_36755 [Burkholderia arboris]
MNGALHLAGTPLQRGIDTSGDRTARGGVRCADFAHGGVMISTRYPDPVSIGATFRNGETGKPADISSVIKAILQDIESLLATESGGSSPPIPEGQYRQASVSPTPVDLPVNFAQTQTVTDTTTSAASPAPAENQKPCAASPDPRMAPYATQAPNDQTKRPPGDNRTAQQIIDDNPLLKNLGNQGGIKDNLNKFVGGNMYNDPDQAFKAAALLTNIKSSANRNGDARDPSQVGNGKIDGFTKDGDARHGTEAGLLQDVVGAGGHPGGGWAHLEKTGHKLDETNDSHVNLDGTNKDNLQWGLEQAGKYIGAFFKAIGKSVIDIITKGRLNPVSAILTVIKNVGVSEAKTAIENSNLGKDAKQTADKVFSVLDNI